MSGTSAHIAEQICEVMKMADNAFNEELLIGAFGTLCDFLVDMQLCARDCPYSGNRNDDGECAAWQVIHDIRKKRETTKG